MAQEALRPLELSVNLPNVRPTKLSAILSGFNECYATILAFMQMVNGKDATINFDRNHDDQVQADSDYFCSTGIIDDVQRYYEANWMHLPYVGRSKETCEKLWDEIVRPSLSLAARHRTDTAPDVECPEFPDFLASGIAAYDDIHWVTYTEVYMCRDEVASNILSAADYIQEMLENYIVQKYLPVLRTQAVSKALAGPHPDMTIEIDFPYFRVNMLREVLMNTDHDLRWIVFHPDDTTEDIKVAAVRNIPNRKLNFKRLANFFEKDPRCGWYDTDIGVFVVKQAEDVANFIRDLNQRFS